MVHGLTRWDGRCFSGLLVAWRPISLWRCRAAFAARFAQLNVAPRELKMQVHVDDPILIAAVSRELRLELEEGPESARESSGLVAAILPDCTTICALDSNTLLWSTCGSTRHQRGNPPSRLRATMTTDNHSNEAIRCCTCANLKPCSTSSDTQSECSPIWTWPRQQRARPSDSVRCAFDKNQLLRPLSRHVCRRRPLGMICQCSPSH